MFCSAMLLRINCPSAMANQVTGLFGQNGDSFTRP